MSIVLLAVHHKGNRIVLDEWLSTQYKVVVSDDLENLSSDVDLCIMDAISLQKHESTILAYKKQQYPKYTPVLLIVHRAKIGIATTRLGKSVDELIVAPIEKDELKARIHGLLRTRSLNVNLLQLQSGTKSILKSLQDRQFALDQHAIVSMSDLNGCITYANDKLCTVSGYSREELIGKNHSILNSGYHTNGFWQEMYHTLSTGHSWHAEVCNRAKNGNLFWVDTTIAPLGDEGVKLKEYISIRTDMTERKRIEQVANAANLAKSEFLANMSHEIRTPMNGVVGMVDILQTTELTQKQHRMVRTIRDSALSLLSILNDILDFSKIEAGKMSMESIPTNLRDVVESVAQLMIPTVASKDLDFNVFVSPELPSSMLCDPLRLRQILFNLLGNAVKFAGTTDQRRGQVLARAFPMRREDGQEGLCISVVDNGIGMSPETLERLFDSFTQADASTTRRFGGTGLGLNITKRLVDMLQGQMCVQSELGAGSEFRVVLPLSPSLPPPAQSPEVDLTGVRLLVVTADPLLQEILTAYLTSAGVDVHLAADLGVARVRWNTAPDTHVMILGPDVRGDIFKTTSIPPSLSVVHLTPRKSSRKDREITVPVNPLIFDELVQGVSMAAGKMSWQTKSREELRTYLSAPTVEQALADGRLILLAEDNEINCEVIQEQLRILGYASEVAHDGIEALTLWRSSRYSLLLTDCHMPKMDGFQLTKAIRMEEKGDRRFPIIAVTANAMQGEAELCLEQGMDDYLPKPLRLEELRILLKKWLPNRGKLEEAPAEPIPLIEVKKVDNTSLVWDSTVLPRLVGSNAQVQRRLLDTFLQRSEELVTNLGNSIAVGEPARIADIAHQLKSPAFSVGAMQLGKLCEQLESAGKANDMQTIHVLADRLVPDFERVTTMIRNE